MCKINSSEHNILSYKCNDLKFCEHKFNSAQSANFVNQPENPCTLVRVTQLVTRMRITHGKDGRIEPH